MPLSISQTSIVNSGAQPLGSSSFQINGNITPVSTASSLRTSRNLTNSASVISVSEEGRIESPFVSISEQAANLSNQNQPLPASETIDQLPGQIRNLNQQQQQIRVRQEDLAQQERSIEQEINLLQRKELEINRKRFELQRQSSIGSIINLQI
ncbi:hypothetical protein FLL45_05935 [Aliikangiella marina]|uniref:Uncharacterized protein n=1 Tax=Aliikangiella marina TaxID=1712262 RepID=A0A545TJS1_9GAMM|nr:hypothetical protein [Aliikangiella marina]TQV77480.1 hypothetical protein FLL45_05935 [Aliikangiella marina]